MITPISKFFSLILVMFILGFSSVIPGGKNAGLQIITDNIVNGLLTGTIGQARNTDVAGAEDIIALTAEDGENGLFFPDINYEDPDRVNWPAGRHIARTERLAILYRLENDPVKKDEYRTVILKLLDHWINRDYQNSNWWHNKLSAPNVIGETALLMKDDLSRRQLLKLSALTARGSLSVDPSLYAYGGANTVDLAMSTIKFGALTGSGSAVKTAVNAVAGELKYSNGQGLKKDHTYFQHGNRLYMGGYGIEYINAMSAVIGLLSGTDYIFTREQLTPFADFILDGLKVMSFGDTLDPTTIGRSVSRLGAQPLRGLAGTLTKLASVEEMPRKEEIAAYVDSILNDVRGGYGLRCFDIAKFIVINNEDFYFSFRGGEDDLVYSEVVNDENILGYNASVPGVTTVMRTGDEYTNISPLFDYSFVPGTTAVYETDEELRAHGDFSYRNLSGTYGSVSDGSAAVLSSKTTHEGISAAVTCFAVDNAAVLLGAGIKDSAGREMNTTLDQCFYAGSFTRDGNTVIHNGIRYTVLEGGELTAVNEHRTGNWHRNNLSLADIPAEGDIFTVSLKNTGSYAYSIMSENTDADFEVITNTEKVQAVKLPDGRIAAAFFAKTSFSCGDKTYSGKAGDAKIFG